MEPREPYGAPPNDAQAGARSSGRDKGNGGGTSASVRGAASDAARQASRVGKDQAERAKETLSESTQQAARAVDRAADELRSSGQSSFAQGASQLAGQLSNAASWLESHSIDDLLRETERLARRNPAMFVAGSVAVGFAFSRFLKASESPNGDTQRTPERAFGEEFLGQETLGDRPEDVSPYTATMQSGPQKGVNI